MRELFSPGSFQHLISPDFIFLTNLIVERGIDPSSTPLIPPTVVTIKNALRNCQMSGGVGPEGEEGDPFKSTVL